MNSKNKSLFLILIAFSIIFISLNYTYAKDEDNFNPDDNSPKVLAVSGGLWGTIKSWFVSTPSVRQAERMVLYGTNFTSTDNAVKFTSKEDTGKEYEVLEIPSNDGSSIVFNVPADIIPGAYTIKAGAFNSDWSNTLTFNVLGAQAPTLSFTATPSAILLGQSSTISWISSGATSCTGESNLDKVSTEWDSPGLTGSFSFIPSDNVSFTLICNGPGGKVTKTASISVLNFAAPIVSLNATSKNITEGQGTTLSWSTSRVSSCYGLGTGDSATLSKWNKIQPITGSLYITPSQNSSLSLVCAGNGGNATSTVNIGVIVSDNISVTCSTIPETGGAAFRQPVTYIAKASGGNGIYIYSWTGTDGLVGNEQSVSKTYYPSSSFSGEYADKTASVTVTSKNKTSTAQCRSIRISSSATPSSILNISSIFPNSGTSTTNNIILRGTNFNTNSTVLVSKGTATYTVLPTYIPASYPNPDALRFNLSQITSASSGTYTIKVSNQGSISNSVNFNLTAPTPTLQLSATPSTINIGSGQQIVVSWSATNVSSCKGDTSNYNPSPIWRNPGSSGSFSFSPSDSTVLTLICVGDGGSVTKNVSINVIPLATAPVLNSFPSSVNPGLITINGSGFDTSGSNNIKFVKVTGSDWERSLNVTTSNANRLEVNVLDIPSGSYYVTVSNKNGISAWQTLTIVSVPTIITPPVVTPSEKEVRITNPATPPTVTLTADPLIVPPSEKDGEPVTISWTSTNASSCVLTTTGGDKGDDWSGMVGPVDLSGSFTGNTAFDTAFTVTCTGAGGTASKTVSVTVGQESSMNQLWRNNMAQVSYSVEYSWSNIWTHFLKIIGVR
ncbi:MAG: Cell wall surface anchored protein [Parcubacteria group bacterium GW2011_GWA2_36_24]|nr:MAG: Cell wall surface anchored protein [Parcubacteria group bacterium GW2011_GWA2_36_24]